MLDNCSFFYLLLLFYPLRMIFKFNIRENIYFILQNMKITINKFLYFSNKEEENFYNSIKDKLSYSVLTKKRNSQKNVFKRV